MKSNVKFSETEHEIAIIGHVLYLKWKLEHFFLFVTLSFIETTV